jgi:hypothetical protein
MTSLLTSHETKMGKDQVLRFSELEDAPPYLLDFQGSVAERHIENLQVGISLPVACRTSI